MQNVRWALPSTGYPIGWYTATSAYQRAPSDWPKSEDWNPFALSISSSRDYLSHGHQSFIRLEGGQTLPAECGTLMQVFSSSEGEPGQESFVEHTYSMDFRFPAFPFPQTPEQMPSSLDPIPADAEATLHLKFERAVRTPDGRYTGDYRIVGEQEWKLANLKCAKPFTATPNWEINSRSREPFYRIDPSTNERQYLTYTMKFTADECTFEIPEATFQTYEGKSVTARLGGYFVRERTDDPDSLNKGFKIAITNIELASASPSRESLTSVP